MMYLIIITPKIHGYIFANDCATCPLDTEGNMQEKQDRPPRTSESCSKYLSRPCFVLDVKFRPRNKAPGIRFPNIF